MRSRQLLAALATLLLCWGGAAHALGRPSFVLLDPPGSGGVVLVQGGQAATLHVDTSDYAGVARAAGELRADIERVSGLRPVLDTASAAQGANLVLIGTLGKSALIDRLAQEGKIVPPRSAASGKASCCRRWIIRCLASSMRW